MRRKFVLWLVILQVFLVAMVLLGLAGAEASTYVHLMDLILKLIAATLSVVWSF